MKVYIEKTQHLLEEHLFRLVRDLKAPDRLKESIIYSIEAGGKRLRPILMIASYQALSNANVEKVFTGANALEMIHTYSLVHDDLPAMDDDAYRRGKPTNHKMFDEATAILAGDGLLTYSFEVITNDPLLSSDEKVQLIQWLSRASGPTGMVAGQILDMEAENQQVALERLEEIHAKKTGELLSFSVQGGAYLGGATNEQLKYLKTYAYYLGLIFQVQDDILDVTGDETKLGKKVGSDEGNLKSTYPKLLGLEGAIKQKELYQQKAREALQKANVDTSILMALIDLFGERDH